MDVNNSIHPETRKNHASFLTVQLTVNLLLRSNHNTLVPSDFPKESPNSSNTYLSVHTKNRRPLLHIAKTDLPLLQPITLSVDLSKYPTSQDLLEFLKTKFKISILNEENENDKSNQNKTNQEKSNQEKPNQERPKSKNENEKPKNDKPEDQESEPRNKKPKTEKSETKMTNLCMRLGAGMIHPKSSTDAFLNFSKNDILYFFFQQQKFSLFLPNPPLLRRFLDLEESEEIPKKKLNFLSKKLHFFQECETPFCFGVAHKICPGNFCDLCCSLESCEVHFFRNKLDCPCLCGNP